ncbi:heparan-alpha-glucosaminide N-acetyltransferase domain-containing protein [Massilia sp. W12]|uniref:DUF1624 domain-containing protein n=1 Tax=Massilia sp. W12 TaxID=3126507 RepID=UPI0030D4FBD0
MSTSADTSPSHARLAAPDLLRGLVIMLMALDHVRDFFVHLNFNPTDLSATSPAWFLTRWITHLCAPAFVLLAGLAAWLRMQRVGAAAQSRYLLQRGALLILLEVSWINFSWQFEFGLIVFQVIWALGVAMLALGLALWLPRAALIALAALLILPHNLLDAWHSESAPLWLKIWHQSGGAKIAGLKLYFLYPLMPWIGLMLAGFAIGPLCRAAPMQRSRHWLHIGLMLLLAFVLLRSGNWYGDPHPWRVHSNGAVYSLLSFINVHKYPPSLQYLCLFVGLAMLLLAALENMPPGWWRESLALFGRHPLLFYCLHIAVLHAAGMLWMEWRYGPVAYSAGQGRQLPPEYAPSLLLCYSVWLLALLLFALFLRTWENRRDKRRVASA